MPKTEKSLKAEKIIETLININNTIEAEYYAMGEDFFAKATIKFDPKTNINEIDDDFINKHNQIQGNEPFGHLNKIKHGTKFYGTVYVRIIKLEEVSVDENGQEEVSTNINPKKDDINWSLRDEIFDQILTRLYKFLPDSIYDIDVELIFRTNGV